MTKLQKQPPPAYSGRLDGPTSLGAAVPYEQLPQSVSQPILSPDLPGALSPTNPFSPNYDPRPASLAAQSPLFSPVSPLVEPTPVVRQSQSQILAPAPQRLDGTQRRSADLRRLDGTPYPGSNPSPNSNSNSAEKGQKVVRVAKDMHDGALPPVYRRQASDPVQPSQVVPAPSSNAHECRTCGGRRRGEGQQQDAPGDSCTQCGKRKVSGPATSTPAPANAAPAASPAPHARTPSEGMSSHRSRPSDSTAGPSSSRASSTGVACCNKCGRYKRPSSLPLTQGPFNQRRSTGASPATASIPMGSHPAMRIHNAGLSIQPHMSGPQNPAYPQIDVIPPSASTYRGVNSPFTNYGDEAPLVGNATKQEIKLFRNSSLVRSLSRRLSRKDKQKAGTPPLPSQQIAGGQNQSGEQSAGRLINMISSAMQGPPNDRDAQYSMLNAMDQPDRPQTPFSFVGGKDENDAFEMVDLREKGSLSSHESLKEEPEEEFTVTKIDGNSSAIPQDTIDVIPRAKSAGPTGVQLSVPDDAQRVPITRFKSLRSGVSRMNSNISRSTSLKRLGSLKTVHHNWYRDDMAIEGAMGENAVAAF